MLTIIFSILLVWAVGKLFLWGIRAAWKFAKILYTMIFLPLLILGLVYFDFVYIVIPIIMIAGIVALIGSLVTA